ncbi:LiaF transmembrane domain-containing protein [Pedobacter gandavensis]|uniref:LiaF transmembrane domain-containing protein n=1 Tax=Pedobacter gandavensis TaxID=2679963 RepID=A0ABR6EYU9_9SPHI|nr:DUF5668 domain-containing protein [Pedobacter gandavensis]MBB2150356.1 hypothetical protein [Pedobacter gandavensis]
METQSKSQKINFHVVAGVSILAIGLIMILDNLGLELPSWLFSWSTILLGIGLWMGYRKDFKVAGWVVLVIIGAVYTLGDFPFVDLSGAKGALVLIGLGVYMLVKPKSNPTCGEFNAKKPIQF